jgi:hypothetical protein
LSTLRKAGLWCVGKALGTAINAGDLGCGGLIRGN